MCGLAGIYRSRPGPPGELASQVRAMVAPLVHRGPDDEGEWTDDVRGIALGFRRLSILDLSPLGHQPMASPSGRFILVFNGEVYNEAGLRDELASRGWRFRGRSDTEVILAAFEAWGIREAVRRFVGMFAMAVWDREERRLTLLRDRLGIKPLFVHAADGVVTFGSELKALMAGPAFDPSISPEALCSYLRFLYVPAPRSIFEGVVKLAPGHLIEIREPDEPLPESEAYWSLEEVARSGREAIFAGSDREAVDRLEALLTDAVALRMRADVPLGALLSGGIDSTTVVALMQKASARPVKTFTIGFGGGEHDESAHAAAVAEWLGTEHTELQLRGEEAIDVLPLLPEIFDEPLADPSQVPTYLVSKLARQDVTVAMSGDGGDELFAGYNRYIHGAQLMERMLRVPAGARRAVGAGIGRLSPEVWGQAHEALSPLLPASLRHRLAGEKMIKLGALMRQPNPDDMYRSLLSAWQSPEDLVVGATGANGLAGGRMAAGGNGELLRRMALADQGGYLPDDLLAKVDRASMARSLEVRVPILDHRVVEFSWTLPAHLKIRDGRGKWILREVLYRHVPGELVDRPKVGFSVPIGEWLAGPLRPWAEDLLSHDSLARDGLLEPGPIRRAWARFLGGRGELALGLWAVLIFQAWRARWLTTVPTR